MSQKSSRRDDTVAASVLETTFVPDSQTSETTASPSTRTAASVAHSQSSATDLSQSHPAADDGQLGVTVAHKNRSSPGVVEEDSGASSPTSRVSKSPDQSSKRMAGGAFKSRSPSRGEMASASAASGPSVYRRKSSLEVSGRRISELSLQLKTRLTYAMIKVQNGWEQHSIDEVESLAASALSSPLSTTSTTMSHGVHSPRTAMASIGGRLRGSDAYREPALTGAYRSATTSRPGTGSSGWPHAHAHAHASPDLHGHDRRGQPSRTLAPAPDLRPRARHHQHADSKTTISTEPPPRVSTPTPQEKDAVDTLLFMSSPANSQRFTHRPEASSAQNSPSRGQFNIPRRSFGAAGSSLGPPTLYDRASASSEDDAFLSTSTKRGVSAMTADAERRAKRRSYGRLENEMDVDRLLDQMRDVASSEEETDIAMPVAATKPVVVRM